MQLLALFSMIRPPTQHQRYLPPSEESCGKREYDLSMKLEKLFIFTCSVHSILSGYMSVAVSEYTSRVFSQKSSTHSAEHLSTTPDVPRGTPQLKQCLNRQLISAKAINSAQMGEISAWSLEKVADC